MLDNTTTKIASETTTSFTFNVDDNFTYIVDQLADSSATAKNANKLKKGLMVDALTELQDMESNGLKFANAINWQKVVEGGKSIDKLADVKAQIKLLVKAASSIEDIPAEVESLTATLKAITSGLENG